MIVEKEDKSSIVKAQFVDEAGVVLAGGDYFVDADGNDLYSSEDIEKHFYSFLMEKVGEAYRNCIESHRDRIAEIVEGTGIGGLFGGIISAVTGGSFWMALKTERFQELLQELFQEEWDLGCLPEEKPL